MSSGRGRHTSHFSGFLKSLTIVSRFIPLFILSGCMVTGSAAGNGGANVSVAQNTAPPTATTTIVISPSAAELNPGASLQYSATGGTAPYTYSVTSGGGSINSGTGLYTAPDIASNVQVTVTDVDGNSISTTLTISVSDLTITASSLTVGEGQVDQITGSGGTSPYAYCVVSGGGSIDPMTGLYTAPSSTGSAQVSVEDASGEIAYLVLTISP